MLYQAGRVDTFLSQERVVSAASNQCSQQSELKPGTYMIVAPIARAKVPPSNRTNYAAHETAMTRRQDYTDLHSGQRSLLTYLSWAR